MVDHNLTSKSDMFAAFSEVVEIIQGEPTMREFLRVLQHLMLCAELHKYSNSKLNFLPLFLNKELYVVHTTANYPGIYIYLGVVSEFTSITEGA